MFINSSWVKCRLHSSFIPISWMMHVYEPNRAYGWLPRILANSNKLFTRTTFSVLKTTNSISIMSFSNETNRTSRYSYMHFTWNSVHSMQHLNYLSFHGQFKRQTCCSPTSFSRNIMVLTQRIMNEFPPSNSNFPPHTFSFVIFPSSAVCVPLMRTHVVLKSRIWTERAFDERKYVEKKTHPNEHMLHTKAAFEWLCPTLLL